MVIRRTAVAVAPIPARRTPSAAAPMQRRQSCIREVTQSWEISKYRQKRKFTAGMRVTIYNPDANSREFLVEFYPGLRLFIHENELDQFTKEI